MRKSVFLPVLCCIGFVIPLFLSSQENSAAVQNRKQWRTLLSRTGDPSFRKHALAGMKSTDPVIRSFAVMQYFEKYTDQATDTLLSMASDSDYRVAYTIFGCAKAMKSHENKMKILTAIANSGKVPEVKRLATSMTTFNFHRETLRLKNDPTHDHEVVIVKTIPLPLSGWKFALDPMSDGHKRKVFAVNYPDQKWKSIRINAAWESQGFKGYDGIAWYRLKFKMPPEMKHNAVELHFEAVDESAWIWLNGIYVGQHDKGSGGWKTPFWIDVTKEIQWGRENTLAIRIQDTAGAGGIWKKAFVEILK
ncbi:MAG: beta galactosidase jelly roll domain-containing protein [Lentisphaeria bacterium]|nr:beta galactosidase jelly roll domain-containing protein [Lentisphaeria bacterium]